jgi:hypothetical protein
MLNPGETAGLDSEEGRSLNFTCGERATALLVDSGEREKRISRALAFQAVLPATVDSPG